MPAAEDYFDDEVAATYDDAESEMFDAAVVGPTVDLIAELADGGAQRGALGGSGGRRRAGRRLPASSATASVTSTVTNRVMTRPRPLPAPRPVPGRAPLLPSPAECRQAHQRPGQAVLSSSC